MSRTRRNIEHSGYFRSPKHKSDYVLEQRALDELEGQAHNRCKARANHAGSKSTPNNWDDIDIAARSELDYKEET